MVLRSGFLAQASARIAHPDGRRAAAALASGIYPKARELAFNPRLGWRATPSGTPVCVHPYRVGMPPGAYASAGEPLPDLMRRPEVLPPPAEALVLPEALDDLSAWMVAQLRVAGHNQMFTVVARLEREAAERFAPGEVVKILRRVLSVEMARA